MVKEESQAVEPWNCKEIRQRMVRDIPSECLIMSFYVCVHVDNGIGHIMMLVGTTVGLPMEPYVGRYIAYINASVVAVPSTVDKNASPSSEIQCPGPPSSMSGCRTIEYCCSTFRF